MIKKSIILKFRVKIFEMGKGFQRGNNSGPSPAKRKKVHTCIFPQHLYPHLFLPFIKYTISRKKSFKTLHKMFEK